MKAILAVSGVLIGLLGLGMVSDGKDEGWLFILIGIVCIGSAMSKPKYEHAGTVHVFKKKSCFPYSAQVLTPQGWKEMGLINIGDTILSYDSISEHISSREVTRKLEHPETTIFKIFLSFFSQPIPTTGCHHFLTQRGWVQARHLTTGDKVVMIDEGFGKKLAQVNSVEREILKEPVYNLHTAIEHTYIVSGCVVHNFAYCRILRTWWHCHFIDPQEKKNSWLKPVSIFSLLTMKNSLFRPIA